MWHFCHHILWHPQKAAIKASDQPKAARDGKPSGELMTGEQMMEHIRRLIHARCAKAVVRTKKIQRAFVNALEALVT